MRDRKEIEKDYEKYWATSFGTFDTLILEVVLDIRDQNIEIIELLKKKSD